MRTISQRELRNDNAAVVRDVEAGETITVTRRGVPVARLTPVSGPDLAVDRPAGLRSSFSAIARVRADVSTSEVLDDLRGDR